MKSRGAHNLCLTGGSQPVQAAAKPKPAAPAKQAKNAKAASVEEEEEEEEEEEDDALQVALALPLSP